MHNAALKRLTCFEDYHSFGLEGFQRSYCFREICDFDGINAEAFYSLRLWTKEKLQYKEFFNKIFKNIYKDASELILNNEVGSCPVKLLKLKSLEE